MKCPNHFANAMGKLLYRHIDVIEWFVTTEIERNLSVLSFSVPYKVMQP